ncbi:MAG: protein TolR [Alphaproteobacteria bacterium]|nr:protein TolR [Alphaproteobacteria bacterium]
MGVKLSSGKGSRARRGRSNFDDINMTPFIDVMLVLLIVFMVAAPMMTSGVTVDLPKTKSAALPGNDEPLNVSIKSDGTIFVQNTEVKLEELGAKVEAIAGEKKDTRIFVRGDTAIDYGQVMRAIGEINAAGFSKVALLTDTANVAPKK